ncbi:hypothetical protein WME94_30920 [Sorangium sp. So ce429]
MPTAPEATLVDLVLGIPGGASRVLGMQGLLEVDRLIPDALAQRTELALHGAQRLLAALELGRRVHAARSRRTRLPRSPRDIARSFEPRLAPPNRRGASAGSVADIGRQPACSLSFRALTPAPRPRPARVASLTRRV